MAAESCHACYLLAGSSGCRKTTGIWGSVLGGIFALVSGNAVPGIVLGILIGKSAEENGYKSKIVQILIAIVVVMFIAIAYFRGFFGKF